MNVVYDLLGFQSKYHSERGIARYVLQLGLALERVRPGLVSQFMMHPDLPFPAGAEALVATGRVVRTDQDRERRRPTTSGVFVAGSPFEAYHLPSEHVLPSFTRSGRWRTAAVLHDLVPHRFPELYLPRSEDRYTFGARFAAVKQFDHLLTNSQATADEAEAVLDHGPERVTVIGAGADQRFRRPDRPREAVAAALVADGSPPGLRPGYVVMPSNTDPRKNLHRALRAWGRLDPDLRRAHQLVLVCKLTSDDRRSVDAWVDEAGIGEDFLATGYVTDELLCRLYQGAHLVLFPSLYEGFGLPALEAISCGAPLICGDSSALKEVQGLDSARFDPTSEEAIAETATRALIDDEFRRALTEQAPTPFTWENAARLTGEVIDGLAEREHLLVSQAPPRPRLALFGPLGQGEAADYVRALVGELRERCDLTVFTVEGEPAAQQAAIDVPTEPSSHFEAVERGGGAFDQVLHVLGPGSGSVEALRSVRRRGGWVVLHDLRLAELYGHLSDRHPGEVVGASVGRLLVELYPHRYRAQLEALDRIDAATAERAGIVLAREVATAADRILVHSRYEASVVSLDTGAPAEVAYPLPCPEVEAGHPHRHKPPLIGSFGPVAPGRRLDDLIVVLARIRRAVSGARLRLIGPIDPITASELRALARAHDVDQGLELVGELPADEERAARNEVMVAVQLDETAWTPLTAVGRNLACGVPTVVHDRGPGSELPDEAVAKVPVDAGCEELATTVVELLLGPDQRDEVIEAGYRYAKTASYGNAAAALHELLLG